MTRANISTLRGRLSEYLDRVRNGEVVEVLDRKRVIARITPSGAADEGVDPRVLRLEKLGLGRRGRHDPRFRLPRPVPAKGGGFVGGVEAVLAERREGR